MRNLATCYSEHAVKVSDSYCSGPLNRPSYITPKPNPSIQNAVTHTYKTNLSSHNKKHPFFVTITWCSKLICQGFFIRFSNNSNNNQTGFHHQMSKPIGQKCVNFEDEVNGSMKIEVHWDLTSARFDSGPEPLGSYYILIVLVDFDIGFFIGDKEEDKIVNGLLLNRGLTGFLKLNLISQYEQFIGGWNNPISTMARFSGSGSLHEIMIRFGAEEDGPKNPVLSVLVDKKRVVRVKRLQWNFRGNQVIFVDGLLVDVMWDVSGWFLDNNNNNNNNNINNVIVNNNINSDYNYNYINKNNGGFGMFMFRTRSGLDSRLWLEEEERKKLSDNYDERPEFSLLICASNKKPG